MKILRVAVCEEDLLLARIMRETIRKTFLKYNIQSEIEIYETLTFLNIQLSVKKFHLLFLDMDPFSLSELALKKCVYPAHTLLSIVYISRYAERVFHIFETSSYYVLPKTTFLTEMERIIQKFVKEIEHSSFYSFLVRSNKNTLLHFNIRQIIYIESELTVQKVFLKDQEEGIYVNGTLPCLERKLSPKGFLRTHIAYLVNAHYIRHIKAGTIFLSTGAQLPLGKTKSKEFLNAYLNLTF